MWKDIPNYENKYQINTFGQVLSKKTNKILKQSIDSTGYYAVGLTDKKTKIFRVHKLMAITFLNHTPNKHYLVIDHIDNNKLNNKIENIQLVTQRKNISKDRIKEAPLGSSFYKGKYHVRFYYNGKNEYLGSFINKIDAHLAYQSKLKEYAEMS
jgi:hypothetical protein